MSQPQPLNSTPLNETEKAELQQRWRKLPKADCLALLETVQTLPGNGAQQRRLYDLTQSEQ